jgi:hypothetical protein
MTYCMSNLKIFLILLYLLHAPPQKKPSLSLVVNSIISKNKNNFLKIKKPPFQGAFSNTVAFSSYSLILLIFI